ncbi:MAG: bifunctional aspartate transaminase/aspartate 4-decarboxylase [Dehalococcoidia bacterium]|nr:bifunctional aspartate transaminase/aspartate 4-decarboxylase [Dehalococcoidia bacterium]
MKPSEEKRYEKLSPFELKNKLINIAGTNHERMMLNAGRGNPNWIAVTPRSAFYELGLFANEEALRNVDLPSVGLSPLKPDSAGRLRHYADQHQSSPGTKLLLQSLNYIRDELKIDEDDFIYEMVDGISGDHYPEPDRMLSICETIVQKYLDQEMFAGSPPAVKFDLFATEGGTAAMHYIFTSLMENRLLHKGDTIAIGTPIFTPYIEIPLLNDFKLIELEIKQDEDNYWQYPQTEIEKLADPAVKAFFLVHPSNPTAVAMNQDTLARIADLVHTKRRDLIIITDDVYGTFVNDFRSIAAAAPRNTILVYSFSKYFGATGWRLGVIGISQDNAFDKMIAALPRETRAELRQRYSTVVLEPDKMKLIDRMVADSRSVALHHTAGLSTPQQVMMTLFSLYCLLDKENIYKKVAQYIVAHRFSSLYDALGMPAPENKYDTHYYTTIDVPSLARQRYGEEFTRYLLKKHEPIDFVVRLAEDKSIVLMDGGGFDAPDMSIRVSLANLPNNTYPDIGKGISELLDEYASEWKESKKKK